MLKLLAGSIISFSIFVGSSLPLKEVHEEWARWLTASNDRKTISDATLTGKFHYASGKVLGVSGTVGSVATVELAGISAFQKLGDNFIGVALSGAINVS